jgi:hypothetical protein
MIKEEYPRVKKAARCVLEINEAQKELDFESSHAQVLELYEEEMQQRGEGAEAFRESAHSLCRWNIDILSLLVSKDPLVKMAEEILREIIEKLSKRGDCTFDQVVSLYLEFASAHKLNAEKEGPSETLRELQVCLGDKKIAFPSHVSWAVFAANKSLWDRLQGAPQDLVSDFSHKDVVDPDAASEEEGAFRRGPPPRDRFWNRTREGSKKSAYALFYQIS